VGGEHHELYLGLLKASCVRDGLDADDETLLRQFRLHLHRGIGYLAAPNRIRGIADLMATAVQA
jgi:DNA sulfur modification protein DndE